MIYTVIETMADGHFRYVRDEHGAARITRKYIAEDVAAGATLQGRDVMIYKWDKMADSDAFFADHNDKVYSAWLAKRKDERNTAVKEI